MSRHRNHRALEQLEARLALTTSFIPVALGDFSSSDTGQAEFGGFQSTGDALYFRVDDEQLWRTEGSSESTRKIADVVDKDGFQTVLGLELFTVESESGPSVWRTDGTAEGTFELFAGGGVTSNYLEDESIALMMVRASDDRFELWKTDGTAAGSERLEFETQCVGFWCDAPIQLVKYRDLIFIRADNQRELLTYDIQSNTLSTLRTDLGEWNHVIVSELGAFFVTQDSTTEIYTLHLTDGTPDGSTPIVSGLWISDPRMVGERALFGRVVGEPWVQTLWSTDGTAEGTYQIAPEEPTCTDIACDIPYFWRWEEAINGVQLFMGSGNSLWRSDGTLDGTYSLHISGSGAGGSHGMMGVIGDRIFYAMGDAPGSFFSTDGTRSNRLADVYSPGWRETAEGEFVLRDNANTYPIDIYVADENTRGRATKINDEPMFTFVQAEKAHGVWYHAGYSGGEYIEGVGLVRRSYLRDYDKTILESSSVGFLRSRAYLIPDEPIPQRKHTDPLFVMSEGQMFVVQPDGLKEVDSHLTDQRVPVDGGMVYSVNLEETKLLRFSDGTAEGTISILFDQSPDVEVESLIPWQGKLFVAGSTASDGRELWLLEPTDDPPQAFGDLNGDQNVDFADFLIVSANFGREVASRSDGDLDGNGQVDIADFKLLKQQYGKV